MKSRIYSSNLTIGTLLALTSLVVAGLIFKLGPMAIAMCLAFTIIAFYCNSPKVILMMLVFLFPFSGTELIRDNLLPVPGFKPLQLFALFAVIVAFFNFKGSAQIPSSATVFFGIVIIVFAFSILHSYFHLNEINSFLRDPLSPWRYFLSKFCKPLIFLLPALILTKFIYKKNDFDSIAATIDWSLTGLSLFIIILFFHQGVLSGSTKEIRTFLWTSLGTHTNNIANYFILGFPFVLSRFFIGKGIINLIKIALISIGIALLFSRSAYCLFILSFFIYTFISKRMKLLPLVIGIVFVAVLYLIPENVIQRATTGFDSGDKNVIFAGRIDGLWSPLLEEYASKPKALFFGNGRYAIISTNAHKMGVAIQAEHPHNMYIEAILDVGIFGLSIFLCLFGILLRKCIIYLKYLEHDYLHEYLIAVITSLVCFLLSGITDRTFFPDEINGYLWIIVAFAFVLFRYAESGETSFTQAYNIHGRLVETQFEHSSFKTVNDIER